MSKNSKGQDKVNGGSTKTGIGKTENRGGTKAGGGGSSKDVKGQRKR